MQAKDSLVTAKAFLKQFSHIEAVAMQNPLSDDPEDLIDTLHTVEPIAFDELGFEKRGNKTIVIVTHKEKLNVVYTADFKYAVPFNEVKGLFHPMELKLLNLAFGSKSQWEYK